MGGVGQEIMFSTECVLGVQKVNRVTHYFKCPFDSLETVMYLQNVSFHAYKMPANGYTDCFHCYKPERKRTNK